MVARVLRRFGELLDGELGRGEIGIAESEIDDVCTGTPELERELADDRQDVRRQVVDAAKVHALSLALIRPARAPTSHP